MTFDFIHCPQRNPEGVAACMRRNGHTGDHIDADGHVWDTSTPCASAHPRQSGVVCSKPYGHRGGHADRDWWWSK